MEIHHTLILVISLAFYITIAHARIFGGLRQNAAPCPDNAPKMSCMMSPCTTTSGCAAFPNAECNACSLYYYYVYKVNRMVKNLGSPTAKVDITMKRKSNVRNDYCGGCNAKFFVGNNEVTSQCDASATDTFALSKTAPNADENCPPIRCFMDPCINANCPFKPNAACRQHKCQCTASFWEGLVEVTDQCTQSVSSVRSLGSNQNTGRMSDRDCGNQLRMACSISPCDVENCPEYPNAQCRTNYCGGCTAEFWEGNKDVTSKCNLGDLVLNTGGMGSDLIKVQRNVPVQPQVPAPVPKKVCLSSCFFPPCRLSYCAAFPDAECRNNYCGGCRAEYYVGNQQVTSMCRDRVPSLSRMFNGGRRRNRMRSAFSPWMAFLDGLL